MKKIDLAKSLFRKYSHIFMCPLCGATMNLNELNSLICSNHHCFDLSIFGSVHLLPRAVKPTKYDKKLFESRHAICRNGFFREMIGQIGHIVRNGFASTNAKQINVLDVGCGEGSHLADLVKDLNAAGIEALGVGVYFQRWDSDRFKGISGVDLVCGGFGTKSIPRSPI